jgi:hypothetical protein
MSTRSKVLIIVGGAIVLLSMLVTAFAILFSPPRKVLVVTMSQSAVQADRIALKDACGGLPGVTVVADQGNPDPHVQGRFPVRFDIGSATARQETALATCINAHGAKVRGFLTEGDR